MLASSSASSQRRERQSERALSSASSPILACVDASASTAKLLSHAKAMAQALSAPVTILHVLDLPAGSDGPADPVEWNIRRQEAESRVRQAAGKALSSLARPDVRIVEGRPVDQICRYADELGAGIIVVGTGTNVNAAAWELGDTVRKLIDRACGVLFLVPPPVEPAAQLRYRRLLVPLDGSRMAESVLPLATRIAQGAGAELLLAHIVPTPQLTEVGPLEAEDHELRQQVDRRNERVARTYVDQCSSHLAGSGFAARGLVVANGDVRTSLARVVDEEDIDLLVMSAHGHTSRTDVPCGSIAGYMVTHTHIPLLLVMGTHVNHNNGSQNERRGRPPRGPVS